ncbi:MAG: hypothetical protein WBC93_16390 [Sulfitobacter sp.]
MLFLSKLVKKNRLLQKLGWTSGGNQMAHLAKNTDSPTALPHRFPAITLSPENVLSIPCPDPTVEDRARDTHQLRGQYLARQDRWSDLQTEIRAADQDRLATPGGMPVAELLSFGARADVVMAVDHALLDGTPPKGAPLMRGIDALERVLQDHADDYPIAVIVAQAHMDIGWAWRGNGWDVEVPLRNRVAFEAHFDRAREILSSFSGKRENAPALAAAHCALLGSTDDAGIHVADDYATLIDLNPHNAGPMRAMGNYLLPRWFGSYDQLELEARRTAARTQEIWGAGAYTWVQFDAVSADDTACARLDLPFFIEGLRDILQRNPHQHTVNLLASYCANTIGNAFNGNDEADHIRMQIADCADWIVREYLTELHPMTWAHAAQGFDNNLRVRSANRFAAAGQADALRIIANLFHTEIAKGHRIVFTDEGPHVLSV